MIEPVLAGIGLAVCAVLLLRMVLPPRQRRRIDDQARRVWLAMRQRALAIWFWRGRRKRATHEADAAIRRAATRDGNVIRPKAFKRPRKPH